MGGGKVTPISLFDDTAYSNQSETDENEEDDDPTKTRESAESSVYLGELFFCVNCVAVVTQFNF